MPATMTFQSTRPMRGATKWVKAQSPTMQISIHAPHAGRDIASCDFTGFPLISIHAPHAGRDWQEMMSNTAHQRISIHAPHAGRDACLGPLEGVLWYFNPRAPCGARQSLTTDKHSDFTFQSTRPMRGATRLLKAILTPKLNFNPRAPCGARRTGNRWWL